MAALRRYWIDFDTSTDPHGAMSFGLGCGVTAHDEVEALALLGKTVGRMAALPPVARVTEDVDVSRLDPNHVLPNIGDPTRLGVWYPALQDSH